MMKKFAIIIASMTTGLLLCVALVLHLDVRADDWVRLWQGLSFSWIAAVTLLTFLLWWSGARKWAVLSRAWHADAGREPHDGFFLRHYAWQNWVGQFVPPSLALVAGRSWAARHMQGVSFRSSASNAVYDQALEFVLLLGLLPAAYLVLRWHAVWEVWLPVAVVGLVVAGGVFWVFHAWAKRGIKPFLLSLLGWSAFRVALTIVRLAVAVPVLGLSLDPVDVAAATPVVALLALLPLTPGNLGLAEWGWTGVLLYAGNDAVDAGLFALGVRLMLLAVQSFLLALVVLCGQYELPLSWAGRPPRGKS